MVIDIKPGVAPDNQILSSDYTDEGEPVIATRFEDLDTDKVRENVDLNKMNLALEQEQKVKKTSDQKRRWWIKKLFLQYIRKYLQSPDKYKEHPKQINNLPSWFDDALSYFSDNEIPREKKKMLREYFYGLIEYRDRRITEGLVPGAKESNIDEADRQLGFGSPYMRNSEGVKSAMMEELPYEKEVERFDYQGVASEMKRSIPPVDEYSEQNMSEVKPLVARESGSLGNLNIKRVDNEGSNYLNSYIRGASKPKPVIQPQPQLQVPQQVQPQPQPKSSISLTSILVGGKSNSPSMQMRGGFGNLSNIIINRAPKIQPTPQPVQPTPSKQPTATQPSQPVMRRRSMILPKIKRDITIPKIKLHDKKPTKPIRKSRKKMRKENYRSLPDSVLKPRFIMGSKQKGRGYKTLPDAALRPNVDIDPKMKSMFSGARTTSRSSFGRQNMKLAVVSKLKDQCDTAFKRDIFKREVGNLKDSCERMMADVPSVKITREYGRSPIREANMLTDSKHGIDNVLGSARTIGKIKSGSIRPREVITPMDYNFELSNIKKKPRYVNDMEDISPIAE